MAEAGRITLPATRDAVARSGHAAADRDHRRRAGVLGGAWRAPACLYRDVVPSLFAIGAALVKLLSSPDFYWNLGVTAGEVGTGAR